MDERKCRSLLRERAGGMCERCGRYGGLTLHHRRKKSQGGQFTPANCVMLCGSGTTGDHGWVEGNPNDAEWEGFHVRPWRDPAAAAVKYRGRWVFLTEDGKVEYESGRGELAPGDGELRRAAAEMPPQDETR